jgi:hypothetical protein
MVVRLGRITAQRSLKPGVPGGHRADIRIEIEIDGNDAVIAEAHHCLFLPGFNFAVPCVSTRAGLGSSSPLGSSDPPRFRILAQSNLDRPTRLALVDL